MRNSKLDKLANKEYRDAFVNAHIAQGLAYQIRALREDRGWSQRELATRLGLKNQSAVARLEDPAYGKLSLATLTKIASIFDIAFLARFVSFGKLIRETQDLSPKALTAMPFNREQYLLQSCASQVATVVEQAQARYLPPNNLHSNSNLSVSINIATSSHSTAIQTS
jgi:transcriptional regulator with XRE-family HTH domain